MANWYLQVKTELYKLENIKEDEVVKYTDESGRLILDYYRNGIVYHSEGYIRDKLLFETYFSNNHYYELRREFCNQHSKTFEGVFFKGQAYGLSTWWHCNGKIFKQGWRLPEGNIGEWNERDEKSGIMRKTRNNFFADYNLPSVQFD